MAHLIFILVPFGLLAGFHVLVWYERKHAIRMFARQRASLDRHVERIEFIIEHVDLAAFARAEASRIAARLGHDVVRLSLLAVRAVERLLTRLVRYLRTRHLDDNYQSHAPRESAREFVRTLSSFKDHLEATRPQMPPLR